MDSTLIARVGNIPATVVLSGLKKEEIFTAQDNIEVIFTQPFEQVPACALTG